MTTIAEEQGESSTSLEGYGALCGELDGSLGAMAARRSVLGPVSHAPTGRDYLGDGEGR